jgi:hypothetical protein
MLCEADLDTARLSKRIHWQPNQVSFYFTMAITHRDLFPARSTERSQIFLALVLTLIVWDFAMELPALTETTFPFEEVFTSKDPMPLRRSEAFTRNTAPFFFRADVSDWAVTEELGTTADVPDADEVEGEVVSKMMSSVKVSFVDPNLT